MGLVALCGLGFRVAMEVKACSGLIPTGGGALNCLLSLSSLGGGGHKTGHSSPLQVEEGGEGRGLGEESWEEGGDEGGGRGKYGCWDFVVDCLSSLMAVRRCFTLFLLLIFVFRLLCVSC